MNKTARGFTTDRVGLSPRAFAAYTAINGADFGTLCRYATGEGIRKATRAERIASLDAASRDGGAGVIVVDGVRCYVED